VTDPPDADAEAREPGSPGVVGEQPNRFAEEIGPLDESPDGATPSDTTRSSEDSLPPRPSGH